MLLLLLLPPLLHRIIAQHRHPHPHPPPPPPPPPCCPYFLSQRTMFLCMMLRIRALPVLQLQKRRASAKNIVRCIINMSRSNSGEVRLFPPLALPVALALTLLPQLKRESNGSGNTVTIRPGGLSWRLSEPVETHKSAHHRRSPLTPPPPSLQSHSPPSRFSSASESLDDLKRKLDVEHTSISSKLEQGAAARQELQDLKGATVSSSPLPSPPLPLPQLVTRRNRQDNGGSRAQQGVPGQAPGETGKQGNLLLMMPRIARALF